MSFPIMMSSRSSANRSRLADMQGSAERTRDAMNDTCRGTSRNVCNIEGTVMHSCEYIYFRDA